MVRLYKAQHYSSYVSFIAKQLALTIPIPRLRSTKRILCLQSGCQLGYVNPEEPEPWGR